VTEIRRREALASLPAKHLFPYGYPRLERLVDAAAARPPRPPAAPTVLLAPTWGPQSTLHVCAEPLIAALLGVGVRVIMRPHYQTARLAPRLDSDLLISDWSAMAIEYALGLGKPVLFVDVPPRVRNPKYGELGLEPMEMRIRHELGTILPLDRLADAPRLRGRSPAGRGVVSHAQRRVPPGVGVQLRAQRRGGHALNLLPFLMSGVSLATTLRFRSPVLTPALVRRQRRNLASMTGLFFLLFYTFPAGMVLYWTSTNAFQLVSQEIGRWRRGRHRGAG